MKGTPMSSPGAAFHADGRCASSLPLVLISLEAGEWLKSERLTRLIAEATELAAITSAAYGTARYKEQQKERRRP